MLNQLIENSCCCLSLHCSGRIYNVTAVTEYECFVDFETVELTQHIFFFTLCEKIWCALVHLRRVLNQLLKN